MKRDVDIEELRQDVGEVSVALYALGDAVGRLPGADETLARGMSLAIQHLSDKLDVMMYSSCSTTR